MGREVRMVPADWVHPKHFHTYRNELVYAPMCEGGGYESAASEWDEEYAKWQEGFMRGYGDEPKWVPLGPEERDKTYTWHSGPRPSPDDYMPDWPAEQRTHYMMYEDTSNGTPISPAFATPEELAQWLADNNASAFANMTATYEQWLNMIRGAGWAPSAVATNGKLISGVEAAELSVTLEGEP